MREDVLDQVNCIRYVDVQTAIRISCQQRNRGCSTRENVSDETNGVSDVDLSAAVGVTAEISSCRRIAIARCRGGVL